MSSTGAHLRTIRGSVVPLDLQLDRPRPVAADDVRDEQPDLEAYELANATMLATALGTGVYIDTFI